MTINLQLCLIDFISGLQVAALPPDDPVVLAAARELASRAAAEQGRQQVGYT